MSAPWGYSTDDLVVQSPSGGLSANSLYYNSTVTNYLGGGVLRYGTGAISIGYNTPTSAATADTWRDDGSGDPHYFSTVGSSGPWYSTVQDAATVYMCDASYNYVGHFTSPHYSGSGGNINPLSESSSSDDDDPPPKVFQNFW